MPYSYPHGSPEYEALGAPSAGSDGHGHGNVSSRQPLHRTASFIPASREFQCSVFHSKESSDEEVKFLIKLNKKNVAIDARLQIRADTTFPKT